MTTVERKKYLDNWVSSQLLKRSNKLHFHDPWAYPFEDYITACELTWEYLDKWQQDSLTEDIFNEFADYNDIADVRVLVLSKGRHVLTIIEKRCFRENMHMLAMWSLENQRISRQLVYYFANKYKLPQEMINYIFDECGTEILIKPKINTVEQFENGISKYWMERYNFMIL
jgi:uncharacterized protein (DUF608 family)